MFRVECRRKKNMLKSYRIKLIVCEKVHSDNDVSECELLGHFGTFLDNSEDILTGLEHLDCLPSHLRPFSPIIGLMKKTRSGPTNRCIQIVV